jgi:60 kDa SS-A/Ro ribonucleoprotein
MIMSLYSKHYQTRQTAQTEPIPGSSQVENSAGGFSFPVDDWVRLDRFLVLGSEGGSYYASEKKLTVENAKSVQACIDADGTRTVARIVEISKNGRAPKNDPAVFCLAMAAAAKQVSTRQAALAALPDVCRIGTHLFQFLACVEKFRGHGRALNRALRDWYLKKEPKYLAYQAVKYQQRGGWSHRDVLRLCKPRGKTTAPDMNAIFHWIAKGPAEGAVTEIVEPIPSLRLIWAMERAKHVASKGEIVKLITDHKLVRECIPTQWLNEPEVWEALLQEMPMTAMVRNLATMTRVGLLAPMSLAASRVMAKLSDNTVLTKSRIHPIAILAALKTYQAGRGVRGSHTWEPVSQIVDALDGAFYLTFKNVEKTGLRWELALDVSSSMTCGAVAGVPGLTPRVASVALAMVTAAVEPQYLLSAFAKQYSRLNLSPKQRLDDICKTIDGMHFGGTDCALPMQDALACKRPIDVFVVLTDSETWAGGQHPVQALQEYRQKMGIPAKLVVCCMVSNGFSIADPNDGGMLDVVGFDVSTPNIMCDFARGGSAAASESTLPPGFPDENDLQ